MSEFPIQPVTSGEDFLASYRRTMPASTAKVYYKGLAVDSPDIFRSRWPWDDMDFNGEFAPQVMIDPDVQPFGEPVSVNGITFRCFTLHPDKDGKEDWTKFMVAAGRFEIHRFNADYLEKIGDGDKEVGAILAARECAQLTKNEIRVGARTPIILGQTQHTVDQLVSRIKEGFDSQYWTERS